MNDKIDRHAVTESKLGEGQYNYDLRSSSGCHVTITISEGVLGKIGEFQLYTGSINNPDATMFMTGPLPDLKFYREGDCFISVTPPYYSGSTRSPQRCFSIYISEETFENLKSFDNLKRFIALNGTGNSNDYYYNKYAELFKLWFPDVDVIKSDDAIFEVPMSAKILSNGELVNLFTSSDIDSDHPDVLEFCDGDLYFQQEREGGNMNFYRLS